MNPQDRLGLSVGVVDGDRGRCGALCALMTPGEVTIRFYASGREALRTVRVAQNAVWLISISLPDMTGFDLYDMLRERLEGAAVCLVADEYRQEDEIRAYRAGAAMYVCRPIEQAWLRESIQRFRPAARRRSMLLAAPGAWSAAKTPYRLKRGVCEVR